MSALRVSTFALASLFASLSYAQQIDAKSQAQNLSSKDAKVRHAAADALADAGPKAAAAGPELTAALGHADAETRWRAARALGLVGAATAQPALVKGFADADPVVRAQCIYAAGLIGELDAAGAQQIAGRIADPDARVRRAAIVSLRKVLPTPEQRVPVLVKVLEDSDPAVVLPALQSLAESGPQALPALMKALETEKAKYWACLIVAEMGPAAAKTAPLVGKLLGDKDPHVRVQAAMALAELGADGKAFSKELAARLTDDQLAVRYAAVFALAKLQASDAVPALTKSLEDKDPFLQMAAAWALAKLNPTDEAAQRLAVEKIMVQFKSEDPQSRQAAAKALLDLKPPRGIGLPAMLAALNDKDPEVRGHIYAGFASLGATAAPLIGQRLTDPALQEHAVRILGMMGPQAAAAVPELANVLKQSSDSARKREVLDALAAIGGESASAAPVVAPLLTDAELGVTAAYVLGKIGPPAKEAVPALKTMTKSEDRLHHLVALWALLRILPGDKAIVQEAVPQLAVVVVEGQSELGRIEAAAALGDLGADAKSALPALKKALDDPSQVVRGVAAEAIKKIGG